MTTTMPATSAVFAKAWGRPPATTTHQLTHAVDLGFHVALCGARTTVQSGHWPPDPTLWDSPIGRCSTCARVVYGTTDRRA